MYTIYCKLRDERKLKDSDVSKATGITKSTFSDWKSGRSKPKLEKLQLIADYFNVSVEYLRGTENTKKETPTEISERDKKLMKATELLQEYSEEDLLWVIQMLEKMSPNKK